MSYVDQAGEWRTRKINMMGILVSFVKQLKPGQDLTRVSIPAIMLFPFSMLEVVAWRELSYFELLLASNQIEDPLDRFMSVLRWFISTIQQEDFHKKPYNPVLGETLKCRIESKEYGKTEFLAEQVSHHPPICAFVVHNAKENVTISSNVSFNVKFGGNHVTVGLDGSVLIDFAKYGEQFEMTKAVPDMVIKNVVLGTKRILWGGEINLACPKHGYSATLGFTESGNINLVKGQLNHLNIDTMSDDVLYEFEGKCGEKISYYSPKKKNDKKLFVDVGAYKKPKLIFPEEERKDPMNSMTVWQDVSKAIYDDDMPRADEEKKKS